MWEGDFGLFWGVGAMTGRCPTVAVVGAGMSGMCVAITLLSAGITDVCIYEKADDVGGTWRWCWPAAADDWCGRYDR